MVVTYDMGVVEVVSVDPAGEAAGQLQKGDQIICVAGKVCVFFLTFLVPDSRISGGSEEVRGMPKS